MEKLFCIQGNKPLKGEVKVSGSKNAALPILASTLISSGNNIIKNLPDISDVRHFLELLEYLGANISKNKEAVIINTDSVKIPDNFEINHYTIGKMRATVLLLAPILARFGEIKMNFPGGCVLGKRSFDAHLKFFENVGVEILNDKNYLHLKLKKNTAPKRIVLSEMSVTATENTLTFLAGLNIDTEIVMGASEPHVLNLMEALNSAGANITESGSHKFKIEKAKNLSNMDISITPDMLEAGTLILAGVLTKGTIEVHGAIEDQLDIFYQKLIESGCNLEIKPNSCKVLAPTQDLKAVNIKTGVFPAFPTDLQAPFAVLMTQAQGISRIYETLFEGRFAFLFELEKMGAQIEMLNPHQAIIVGKTPLKGTLVASQDIRAGASMILAGLSANGTTEISNISYIFRGYDKINQKINSLGGEITLKDIS